MDEEKVTNIRIDHDPQTRKGVYSDFCVTSIDGDIARLDFIQNDNPIDDENINAVLVSRVFLTSENLVRLRDQLDEKINAAKLGKSDE